MWQYGTLFVQMLQTACWLDIRHHFNSDEMIYRKIYKFQLHIMIYDDLCISYQFYLHILYSRHISSNLFLFYWWVPKFQEQITTRNIESSKKHHLTFKPNIISNPPQPVQSNRPTPSNRWKTRWNRGLCSWSSDSTYPTDHTCLIDGAQGFQVDTDWPTSVMSI